MRSVVSKGVPSFARKSARTPATSRFLKCWCRIGAELPATLLSQEQQGREQPSTAGGRLAAEIGGWKCAVSKRAISQEKFHHSIEQCE
jgi:hypothetical protein